MQPVLELTANQTYGSQDPCHPHSSELVELGYHARQEAETFINAYLNDPTVGWPVVSCQRIGKG